MDVVSRRTVIAGLLVMPLAARAQDNGLTEIIKRESTIRLDLRYATTNNFTGRVLYDQARAFMQGVAAEALIRAHARARADGFGLTIFDAYRPWRVTKQLWDATPPAKRNYVANPAKGSRHNRGCAIDLSLHSLKTGKLVDMPTGFDDFSERAHRDYRGASPTALANRARLARYMEAEGFIGMSNEWWHFDYRDWADYPVLDVPFTAL
jgi:zinc D-Ala-D-Ala dipeptidase